MGLHNHLIVANWSKRLKGIFFRLNALNLANGFPMSMNSYAINISKKLLLKEKLLF